MPGKRGLRTFIIIAAGACVLGGIVLFGQRQAEQADPVPVRPVLPSRTAEPAFDEPAKDEVEQAKKEAMDEEIDLGTTEPVPPAYESSDESDTKDESVPVLNLDHLAGTMTLSIPGISPGGKLPLAHSCYQSNISPALEWSGAPESTKSYVVFLENRMEDSAEELYWLVFNIPADTDALPENIKSSDMPAGVAYGRSDHNNAGYVGPCDPKGEHRYTFGIFALDTVLDLPSGVHKYDLIRAMNGHVVDMAEFDVKHYFRL